MAKIIIDQDRCKGCFLCVNFCPKGLIKKSVKLNKQGLNFVEFVLNGNCIGCRQCEVICPDCCIQVCK